MASVTEIVGVLANWIPLALIAIGFYFFHNRERRNVPPGPTGLPLVGYIPFLSSSFSHYDLLDLSKKYGSVFSLKLGLNNVIIINDFANAVEALNDELLQDRPPYNIFKVFSINQKGGMTSWSGQIWKDHRRFTLRALRSLGVGKQEIEDLVTEEISFLLAKIEKTSSQGKLPIQVRDLLAPSASNVVNSVLLGRRLDYEDPIRKLLTEVFTGAGDFAIPFTSYFVQFIQFFGWLLQKKVLVTETTRLFEKNNLILNGYIEDEAEKHLKKFDANNPKDFADLYIAECKNSTNPHFNVNQVGLLVLDLFGAGSATTKDGLEWTLLFLAKHQGIQAKVVAEISDVIGFDRKPNYADRNRMPYLQAVIMETLRKASTIPLNLQHYASEDTKLGAHVVPKGTQILVNLWAIHHDPAYWKEPEKFDPMRFLNEDGTKLVKRDSFMPFSSGRRSCPGEPLAQVQLFAFIVSIVQKFEVTPAQGQPLSDEGSIGGFAHAPKDMKLVFNLRG